MSPASQQAQGRRNCKGVGGKSFPQILAGIEEKPSPPKGLVRLNEYETDPYFLQLGHHLTLNCSSISEDLHRFARNLQHLLAKLFLLLFLNNFTTETITKTILRANLQKYGSNPMSYDGSSIEIINQSH